MLASLGEKSWDRGVAAYEARNRLLRRPAHPRIVHLWSAHGRTISVGFGILAAAGVALTILPLFLLGISGLLGLAFVAVDVTRGWRPLLISLAETAVLVALFVASSALL
jgi:hypothetical protein